MRMRTRAVAILAAIAALVAPATTAHADPLYTLSVSSSEDVVYPAVDGYVDDTTISGEIASPSQARVRAAVVVTVGTRIAKTWMLSSTGPFSFVWDGKVGTSVVGGAYTVTLRVDGETPVSDTFVISPKKVTALTWTKTVTADKVLDDCDDDFDPFMSWFACRTGSSFFSNVSPTSVRIDARQTDSNIYAFFSQSLPSAVRNSLRDPKLTVTAKLSQVGSRTNYLVVYSDGCGCGNWNEKAFKKSGSYSVSITTNAGENRAAWEVDVADRNYVSISKFTIKVVYYALR